MLKFKKNLIYAGILLGLSSCFLSNIASAQDKKENWKPNYAPMPLEYGIQDNALTNAVMSPDGKHIAAVVAVKDSNPVVKVWNTSDLSKEPKVIGTKKMRIFSVSFIKNDALMITANQPVTTGNDSDWHNKTLITDLEGKNWIEPMKGAFEEVQTSKIRLFNRLPSDKNHILVVSGDLGYSSDIYKVNVYTGVSERIARQGDNESFLSEGVGRDGYLHLKQTLDNYNGVYKSKVFFRPLNGNWKEIKDFEIDYTKRYSSNIIRLNHDKTKVWVSSNKDSNYTKIREYDLINEKFSEVKFANNDFDANGVFFWYPDLEKDDVSLTETDYSKSDIIAGYCYSGPTNECLYTDPTLKSIQALLEAQFPNKVVSLERVVKGGNKVLVSVTAPDFPTTWYYLENKSNLTKIVSSGDGFDFNNFAPAQWVYYKARDGLNIPAIVYLPKGYDASKNGRIPLVVMPHGGPWARDYFDWDGSAWSQLFATRGFAVLAPQYRGSDGLGLQLWTAGDKEWGLKMQDDKDDGAKWLVEQGVADPNRMMMFGYSYGGFAAAAAATRSGSLSKGLWQCAIAGAPAIDLERIGNDWGEDRFQRQTQGHTVAGRDPMKHLGEIEIPFLVFHGSFDHQADVIHSRTLASKLNTANLKTKFKYIEIPEMSHTLNKMTPDMRRQFIPAMIDWTANNCGNISASFKDAEATQIAKKYEKKSK